LPTPLHIDLTKEFYPFLFRSGTRVYGATIELEFRLDSPSGHKIVLMRLEIAGKIDVGRQYQNQIDIARLIDTRHYKRTVDDDLATNERSRDFAEKGTQRVEQFDPFVRLLETRKMAIDFFQRRILNSRSQQLSIVEDERHLDLEFKYGYRFTIQLSESSIRMSLSRTKVAIG